MPGRGSSTRDIDRRQDQLAADVARRYDCSTGAPIPDPLETVPLTWAEGDFRHGHWRQRRAKIDRALQLAGTSVRQLARFQTCGSQARVFYSPTEERYLVRASFCKNRHCEPCMRAKAKVIAGNLRDRLARRPRGRYRFVTLTLAHTDAPLPDQVKRLITSFRQLRRTRIFRTQHGGCFVMEVKIGQDKRWHPHLHLITEGAFMPQAELSQAWHKITGDSFSVDVRAIASFENVTHEVTKYITKGTSGDVWDDDEKAIEWIIAAKGIRTCATFGTWRQFRLTQKPPIPKDLVHIGTLDELVHRAIRGDRQAIAIVLELRPPGLRDDTS